MGAVGRELALERFTIDAMMQRITNVYAGLLNGKPPLV
jgi:hypothetical protein